MTAGYRSLLPSYYKFDFVDAELFCAPSPGASDYYAGPYRCWYTSPSSENVASAHKALSRIIATRGPYQMIMGFSQVLHNDISTMKLVDKSNIGSGSCSQLSPPRPTRRPPSPGESGNLHLFSSSVRKDARPWT
jgi:hypothetical protein